MIIATLTGNEWVAIIGAVGTLFTIIGGVIVLLMKTFSSEILIKLGIIQHSVDGNASKQDAKLDATLAELELMKNLYHNEERKTAVLVNKLADSSPAIAITPVIQPQAGQNQEKK